MLFVWPSTRDVAASSQSDFCTGGWLCIPAAPLQGGGGSVETGLGQALLCFFPFPAAAVGMSAALPHAVVPLP